MHCVKHRTTIYIVSCNIGLYFTQYIFASFIFSIYLSRVFKVDAS